MPLSTGGQRSLSDRSPSMVDPVDRDSNNRRPARSVAVSQFRRQTHLDELPQLVNIIGGSMSIVGPRPMIDEVIDELEPIDRKTRAMVKPGLTGPWQMSTMGSLPLHDHPELDNAYVEHASFTGDVRIIWLTFLGMLGRPELEPAALLKRLRWSR